MKIKSISLLTAAIVFALSCNLGKEFLADIPDAPNMLGVYCIFSPDSVWKAKVFSLGNISEVEYDNSQLLIDDAEVKLFGNGIFLETLIPAGNGIYISEHGNKPERNYSYHLEIRKENYPTAVSDTASVPPKIEIDSIFLYEQIKPEYFEFSASYGEDSGNQLDIFFQNSENFPVIMGNAGILMSNFYDIAYSDELGIFHHLFKSVSKRMSFFRCTQEDNCYIPDDYNELQLSFTSPDFFNYYKTAEMQENSQANLIDFFASNVKSNIDKGVGLFAGTNYLMLNIDSLELKQE